MAVLPCRLAWWSSAWLGRFEPTWRRCERTCRPWQREDDTAAYLHRKPACCTAWPLVHSSHGYKAKLDIMLVHLWLNGSATHSEPSTDGGCASRPFLVFPVQLRLDAPAMVGQMPVSTQEAPAETAGPGSSGWWRQAQRRKCGSRRAVSSAQGACCLLPHPRARLLRRARPARGDAGACKQRRACRPPTAVLRPAD